MRKQARQILKRGFTMVELLVVISIIVLMLAVAVPVVRVVQGNRSVEAGYNAIAAALGHARQLALYYRQPAGVVFYRDPITGLQDIGYVTRMNFINQLFTATTTPPNNYYIQTFGKLTDQYLDMIPGEPIVTLPTGLAVQVLMGNGAQLKGPSGTNPAIVERYMRLGIVLFDEDGQLASIPYSVSFYSLLNQTLWQTNPTSPTGSPLANAIQFNSANGAAPLNGLTAPLLFTHPAICLYDEETYLNQIDSANTDQFSDDNNNTVTYNSSAPGATQCYALAVGPAGSAAVANTPPTQVISRGLVDFQNDKLAEQNWLDQNGEVLVIKPNDGSLLRNK